MMDDDRPYLLDTGRGILAELPVHWMLDDWEQYAFLPEPHIGAVIESPAKVLDLWGGELEALADEGGLMVHTSHPFLSGRASRVATLERVVERARELGGVWIAPAGEIAAHARSRDPRRARRGRCPSFGSRRTSMAAEATAPGASSGRPPGSSARRAGGTSSSTT